MTKSLKESQLFDIVSGKEFGRETAVHSLDTYQEDNAFMRKMEKIRFEDMNRQELQEIYKIALRCLKTRYALDKAIAKLRVREHETMQLRAINNGLVIGADL